MPYCAIIIKMKTHQLRVCENYKSTGELNVLCSLILSGTKNQTKINSTKKLLSEILYQQ